MTEVFKKENYKENYSRSTGICFLKKLILDAITAKLSKDSHNENI